MLLLFLPKSALSINPTISDLSTSPFCFIFASSYSMSNIFASQPVVVVFLTKFLSLDFLFSTAVNTALVAKLVILSILLSISVILAL